jgi:hypothetical protein
MGRKGRRTKGMEEAHPFAGMSRINSNAAGMDIGAVEIVVCVGGDGDTQIVRAFGNYTVDLQAIGKWLKEYRVETVATPAPTAGAVWKARGCIGSRCSKNWSGRDSNVC